MSGVDGTLKFDTKIDNSGFSSGVSKLGSIASKGISACTKIFGAASAAITTMGGAAIKVGSDFEAGMSQVQAVSGASGEALEALKEKAKEMGAKTKFSATESAEAMNYMAMAGWKTEDMLGGIEGIMNLAAASGENLATTSDIVTDALTAFGMSASDSTHFADILAAASSNANTNVAMMGETFKYVAPVAGALGYSAEDTALAVGLMANSGIKASQAGTSLRSALTRLTKPTDEVQSKMVELGLAVQKTEHVIDSSKVDKLQGKIADKTAAMQKAQINYNNAVSKYGADSAQAQKAAINLETAQRKLAETSGDLSAAQAGTNKVVGITNTLMTDGKGNMNSFYDVIVQLRESFKGLSQEQQMQAAATLFGQEAMSGMLAIINASDKDFEKLAGSIGTCSDGIGAAAEMAEVMQDNLQGQLTILKSGLEGLGISLYETMQDTAKNVVKEAQGMVQQLQDAFNAGGFQGIVSAFGDVLAQVVQRIAEEAPAIIDASVSLVVSFCDGLKSAPGISESGASLITALVTGLMSCTGEILTTAIVLIGKLAEGVAAGAPRMVQAASDALMNIVEALADWMPDILQAGADIIVALTEGIAGALPTLITQAAVIVTDMAMALVNNLPALVDAALQLVMGLAQGLVDGFPVLLEGAIQLFTAILEAMPVVIEQLLQALPELITTIITFFTGNIPLIVDGAIQLLMGIIDAIPVIIQAIVDNLPQIITALVNGLVGALPQLLEAAITLLMAVIQAIPEIVVAIAENLPQIITAIVTGLVNAIPTIFSTAKDLLWNIITAIPEIVAGLAEAVPNIISGIVNGLLGGIGAVKDAAIELSKGILSGIKGFFGINSPSTLMTEQGDYLVQGLVNGMDGMPAELAAKLSQTALQITEWGQQMLANVQTAMQNVVGTASQIMAQLPVSVGVCLTSTITSVNLWGQQMTSVTGTALKAFEMAVLSAVTASTSLTTALLVTQSSFVVVNASVTALSMSLAMMSAQTIATATAMSATMAQSLTVMVSQASSCMNTMQTSVIATMTAMRTQVQANSLAISANVNATLIRISNLVVTNLNKIRTQTTTTLILINTLVRAQMVSMNATVRSAMLEMVRTITSNLRQLPGIFKQYLDQCLQQVDRFKAELIRKGQEAAQGFRDAIKNGLDGIQNDMRAIGEAIVDGIWSGIDGKWGWLEDQVRSKAKSLLDAAKKELDVNSPSGEFRREFGRWLMPGAVLGVEDSMPETIRDMQSNMAMMVDAMRNSVYSEIGKIGDTAGGYANAKAVTGAGTTVYADNSMHQNNEYHVPVATPSETAKAQRDAFRKFVGGPK